jgi:NAD(P)-dependent dehydrogenase (short-subunit alcohol dehydrogenase family)
MPLKNKVALVTGASKGIGRGIALALAREGCALALADVDEAALKTVAQEISDLGSKVLTVKCDVSQKTEVDEMIKKTVAEFGTLDILVNNAGIYPFVPFMNLTEADWDKVMDVNLKSIFMCSQAAAKIMPNGSRIINISSIAAVVGFAGLAHYCASKGGINSLTRVLALELADKKITVNAVAPGAIETPGASQGLDEATKKQTIAMIPLARMGQPEDIAGTVTFLASDQASYITGQAIIVDGGWTLR